MVLTDDYIEDGKELIQKLDQSGLKVDAGLWFFFPDISNWKLVLSVPDVSKTGPKTVYKEIQRGISKVGLKSNLMLDDISLLKPDAPLIQLMRQAVRTGSGISSIRFSNNVINGMKVEDALIYRL